MSLGSATGREGENGLKQEEKRTAAERRYVRGGVTLRTLAEEMGVSYDTVKAWSREGKWAQMRRERKEEADPLKTGKNAELNRLMEASDEIEEALHLAASGIKRRIAEDADGEEIADGKFRAGNLTSITHAIGRQVATRKLLSSMRVKPEKKGDSGVQVQMNETAREMSE